MREALTSAIRARTAQGSLSVIAEIKVRRPGGIDLLHGRDAVQIARLYQSAGAAALSVVTSPWFGGRMAMLEDLAAADLGLPILRKDMISTEKAIQASKRAGASAVLLVLPLLGIDRLAAMLAAAWAESIEPFVEVASRQEIEQIREIHDGIVAINNADIKTNEVEGAGISRSMGLIDRRDHRPWVSASRISSPADVALLAAAGFDGVLVGTHLLLADDLRAETERFVAAARVKDAPR